MRIPVGVGMKSRVYVYSNTLNGGESTMQPEKAVERSTQDCLKFNFKGH